MFYIQAIRLRQDEAAPEIVDWVSSRAPDIVEAKRQARFLSETSTATEWTGPTADFIRVVDGSGAERFRCRCRVALKSRKAPGSTAPRARIQPITASPPPPKTSLFGC